MEWPVAPAEQVDALSALFASGAVVVLSGAGISTDSGIPDYRGPETRRRARNPVQYRDFLHKVSARQRYWARSMLGWPRLRAARPNGGHAALACLEVAGRLAGLITQNVDGLHGVAGSRELVELHGALRSAVCLACESRVARDALQAELERRNPALVRRAAELGPDGDAELAEEFAETFELVSCGCGGALKPDVVFFGENVPAPRVARAFAQLEAARALVVVGSSLAIYSGLRFVHAAHKRGIPIAIVTLGATRADALATLRIDAGVGSTLSAVAARL
jgi:NAD-dependent SIR2 family protein deacetylase